MQAIVKEMATERLKGALVQAVSLLRQKKAKDSVSTQHSTVLCSTAQHSIAQDSTGQGRTGQ